MPRETDRLPPPLSPSARRLLDDYRRQTELPTQVRSEIWAGLERAEPSSLSRRRWIAATSVLAAAAAGVLLAVATGGVPQRGVRSSTSDRPEIAVDQHQGNALRPILSRRPHGEPAPSPRPSMSSALSSPPTPAETSRPRPSAHPRIRSTTPRASLRGEHQLIARAWSALADRAWEQTRALTQMHREQFPQGRLSPERDAVEALVACSRDGVTEPATTFARTYPDSPLRSRIKAICGI